MRLFHALSWKIHVMTCTSAIFASAQRCRLMVNQIREPRLLVKYTHDLSGLKTVLELIDS